MKKFLLVNILLLFFIISKAQIIQNPSLTTSAAPGSDVVPDSWSQVGITGGLINSGGNPLPGPPFIRPILDLFTSANSNDLFWYFYSNTGGQFGGISQVVQNLEPNTKYCFSFEAAVNRLNTPSTTIDLELYFNGAQRDRETFNYPSETSSRRVELCFTTGTGPTSGTMSMRTNNLQGATTFVLIQAGSGAFGVKTIPCDPSMVFFGQPTFNNGVYQAANEIIAAGTVPNGGNVSFKAGQTIQLNNNFTVEPNADFSAEIENCGQ